MKPRGGGETAFDASDSSRRVPRGPNLRRVAIRPARRAERRRPGLPIRLGILRRGFTAARCGDRVCLPPRGVGEEMGSCTMQERTRMAFLHRPLRQPTALDAAGRPRDDDEPRRRHLRARRVAADAPPRLRARTDIRRRRRRSPPPATGLPGRVVRERESAAAPVVRTSARARRRCLSCAARGIQTPARRLGGARAASGVLVSL